jgi:hypothetical protein
VSRLLRNTVGLAVAVVLASLAIAGCGGDTFDYPKPSDYTRWADRACSGHGGVAAPSPEWGIVTCRDGRIVASD